MTRFFRWAPVTVLCVLAIVYNTLTLAVLGGAMIIANAIEEASNG